MSKSFDRVPGQDSVVDIAYPHKSLEYNLRHESTQCESVGQNYRLNALADRAAQLEAERDRLKRKCDWLETHSELGFNGTYEEADSCSGQSE